MTSMASCLLVKDIYVLLISSALPFRDGTGEHNNISVGVATSIDQVVNNSKQWSVHSLQLQCTLKGTAHIWFEAFIFVNRVRILH